MKTIESGEDYLKDDLDSSKKVIKYHSFKTPQKKQLSCIKLENLLTHSSNEDLSIVGE